MTAGEGRRSVPWAAIVASLIVLTVYSVHLQRLPTHTFWSPDEGCKFLQTEAIRWNGGIDYVLPYPGEGIDPELRFYAGHTWGRSVTALYPMLRTDGSFGFHWPIWFPMLVKAPVALFGPVGGFLVAMLAGWAAAIFSGLLAAQIDRRLAAPAILVVGLSTPVWFYALCFWEHTTAVALALLAGLVLIRGDARLRALLLALAVLVPAVMLRMEMAAFAAALCATFVVVALRRGRVSLRPGAVPMSARRRLLTLLVLVVILIALVAALNYGLTQRHWRMLYSLPWRTVQLAYLPKVLRMLIVPPWTSQGVLPYIDMRIGVAAAVACVAAPFFRRRWIAALLAIFGLGVFAALAGDLATASNPYRTLHSLVPVSPLLMLAAHGVPPAWRDRNSRFFTFTVLTVAYSVLGILAMVVTYTRPDGSLSLGMGWGQRYLLAMYPLLSVLGLAGLFCFWRSTPSRIVKPIVAGLAAVLFVIGIQFELRGFEESRRTRSMLANWQRAIETQGPVLTDIWWLPAALADHYAHKPAFAVGPRREVANFVRTAARAGVRSFTFASFDRVGRNDFGDPPPRHLRRRSARAVGGLYLTRFTFLARTRDGFRR
jgi:hypothetical protein